MEGLFSSAGREAGLARTKSPICTERLVGKEEGHSGTTASMGPGVHCNSGDTIYNSQEDEMGVVAGRVHHGD